MSFWENKIYSKGLHLNRYPYDEVVSFIFNHYDQTCEKKDQTVLEIGCGAGNNLLFAAREGFQVMGIDISKTAIECCKNQLINEGLKGDFISKDFTEVEIKENSIDLAIDRGAICCVRLALQKETLERLFLALKPNGYLLLTPFSQKHYSYDPSLALPSGFMAEVSRGSLAGLEGINFNNKSSLESIIDRKKWSILAFEEIVHYDRLNKNSANSARWHVVLKKLDRYG